MATLLLLFFFLFLLPSVLASAVCNPAFTWYAWAKNSKGQDPCQVADILFPQCNFGNILGPLPANTPFYPPPPGNSQNSCICSYTMYNLLMACGDCQNGILQPGSWPTYDSWSSQCAPENKPVNIPFQPPSNTEIPTWALITNNTSGDPRWSYGLSFALSEGTVILNPNPPGGNPPAVSSSGTLPVATVTTTATVTAPATTNDGTNPDGTLTATGGVITADPSCSAVCTRNGPSVAAVGIGAAAGGLLLGALLVALACLCCLRRRERRRKSREVETYPDLSPRPVADPTPGSSFGNRVQSSRPGIQRPDMYEVQRPYDPFAPSTPSSQASRHPSAFSHPSRVQFPMPATGVEPANALHLQTHPPSQSGHGHQERTPRVSFTAGSHHSHHSHPLSHHGESSPVIDPESTPQGYHLRMT